jgi:hypothetical protein
MFINPYKHIVLYEVGRMEKMKEEKESYLTYWDLKNILGIVEEAVEYCYEGKEKEAYNDIEEIYVNWGVVLDFDPDNCNVFLKYKL